MQNVVFFSSLVLKSCFQVESTRSTLSNFNRRDRSPSVRDRPRLALANRHNTTDNLSNYGSLGRSPSSPSPHLSAEMFLHNPAPGKPKSILKKSNSNIESGTLSYVDGEYYSGDYLGCSGSSQGSGDEDFEVDEEEEEKEEEQQARLILKAPPSRSKFTYGYDGQENPAL